MQWTQKFEILLSAQPIKFLGPLHFSYDLHFSSLHFYKFIDISRQNSGSFKYCWNWNNGTSVPTTVPLKFGTAFRSTFRPKITASFRSTFRKNGTPFRNAVHWNAFTNTLIRALAFALPSNFHWYTRSRFHLSLFITGRLGLRFQKKYERSVARLWNLCDRYIYQRSDRGHWNSQHFATPLPLLGPLGRPFRQYILSFTSSVGNRAPLWPYQRRKPKNFVGMD